MDLPIPILSDPERSFSPRESRVSSAAGRWDGSEHASGFRIDFLNAVLCDLKEVLAVKGCPCVGGNIDRTHCVSACRIEGIQLVSRRKPDVLTVIGDSMYTVGTRKGTILADDFSG
jgi:hypothetical protein